MKRTMRDAIPWIAAFLGAWAVKWMVHAPGDRLGYTNSILSVFVFVALAFCFGRCGDIVSREKGKGGSCRGFLAAHSRCAWYLAQDWILWGM